MTWFRVRTGDKRRPQIDHVYQRFATFWAQLRVIEDGKEERNVLKEGEAMNDLAFMDWMCMKGPDSLEAVLEEFLTYRMQKETQPLTKAAGYHFITKQYKVTLGFPKLKN